MDLPFLKQIFRLSVNEPPYEQDSTVLTEIIYGLADGQPLIQNLGFVETKEGR